MEHTYLIAEDEQDTQLLIEHAFKHLEIASQRRFVGDGREVIDYLAGEGRFTDRKKFPIPAVLLLDLKMPRVNGLEVIQWIRSSPCRELIVVMFSGASLQHDVVEAYRLGINSFVEKPTNFHELVQTVMNIHHYWFACSCLPASPDCPMQKISHRKYKTLRTQ